MIKRIASSHKTLVILLLLSCVVRFYRFDGPIADWHSWRQADTSAVSRNFVTQGFDLLHPKFDDLSNVPSGLDNPHGYRFVEFPLYNLLQAGLYQNIGFFSLEEWGRLVTITASVSTVFFLYTLGRKYADETVGFFAAFFYGFVPFSIYYGRVILPDTTMIASVCASIYFTMRWLSAKNKRMLFFLLAVLFAAASLLLKPYAIFFLLPVAVIMLQSFGWSFYKKWHVYVFAVLSLTPLILWRTWILQFPEGIPVSDWLYNGNDIRFRPAFFRWILYERITKLIAGYTGIIFLLTGSYALLQQKNKVFFLSFFLAALLYTTIFATGNVQHDYYQILIMPTVALFFGLGAAYLIKVKRIGILVVVVSIISMLYFSWMQVRDYFNINNPAIITAGAAVDRITAKDALIIANYNGDTSFLYQTKRKGWASYQKPIDEMRDSLGADYLVLANPTQADEVYGSLYKLVEKRDTYVIYNLHLKP